MAVPTRGQSFPAAAPKGPGAGGASGSASRDDVAREYERVKAGLQERLARGEISDETFTATLEDWRRDNTSVEVISINQDYDPTARPADPAPGSDYRPKVATWGVFPRPKNISNSFGGGRNLAPGKPLESREDAEAKRKRTADALAAYRRKAGLVTDPVAEEQARGLLAEGAELMRAGRLEPAAEAFTRAAQLVPWQ